MAGTGKSTIAHTIASTLHDRKTLGASFFFSRGVGDLGNAARFVTTLARQLAHRIPVMGLYISQAIKENPDIIRQGIQIQWKELIIQPFTKSKCQYPSLNIIIDALDECDNENDIKLILRLFVDTKGMNLGVIVTSRPETPIRLGFKNMTEIIHKDLALHDVPRSIVEHDISIFLAHEFAQIRAEHEDLENWPTSKQIEQILLASNGLFIYAATVCRFVRLPNFAPDEQLNLVIQQSDTEGHATAYLDDIYTKILKSGIPQSYGENEIVKYSKQFKTVVGSIVILSDVLSVPLLASLLTLPARVVHITLTSLHSLLNIPNDPSSPIRLLHPSFRDFLLDPKRCTDTHFWVDSAIAHRNIGSACLRLLDKKLKDDMCGLKVPGILVHEIDSDIIATRLSRDVQYACEYWVDHLEYTLPEYRIEIGLCDNGQIERFFKTLLLRWIEALGLMKKISKCVNMLNKLKDMLQVSRSCVWYNALILICILESTAVFAICYNQRRTAICSQQSTYSRGSTSPDLQLCTYLQPQTQFDKVLLLHENA